MREICIVRGIHMKRIVTACMFMLIGLAGLYSEKLTKVGIVDLNEIGQTYYFDTAELQEVENLKKTVEERENRMIEEIDSLKEELVNAKQENDENAVTRLEEQISQKTDELVEYHSVQMNKINNKLANLQNAQNLSAEIMRAIDYIAEQKGFSLIFNAQDPQIIWHNS